MPTRNEWSRLRASGLAEKAIRRKGQTDFLASLVGDESVLAQTRSTFVSDRRIVEAVWLQRSWTERTVTFIDVSGWSRGEEHDGRPFVILHHPPIVRLEWVPGHRFLWWRWGSGVRMTPCDRTEFSFPRRKDPVYISLVSTLETRGLPEGSMIERRPEGTRAERTGGSNGMLTLVADGPRFATKHEVIDELARGASDWLTAAEVALIVRELGGATTDEQVTVAALDAIRTLLSLGFMQAGDVTDGGFFEWDLSTEDTMHRIERDWRALGRLPNIGEVCWLANTPSGDARVQQIQRQGKSGRLPRW